MRPIRSLYILLLAAPLAAQTAITKDVSVRSAPTGSTVALLKQGTAVTAGSAKGDAIYVTFTGWVDATKIGGAKDSFPAQLTGTIAMRLRSAPSMQGVILGEVRPGTGLATSEKQQGWVKVTRGGWIDADALPASAKAAPKPTTPPATKPANDKPAATPPATKTVAPPAPVTKPVTPPATTTKPVVTPPPAKKEPPKPEPKAEQKPETKPAPVEAPPVEEPLPDGALRVARSTVARSAPNGLVVGQLGGAVAVVPLARSRGWMRVRTEVWVQEKDLVPADSAFRATLTAADLRADPEAMRGKIVHWEVQVLALQQADVLRRELAENEPYFLAKGPGTEDALLYLAIPPSLLSEARAVQPLTRILITARVRSGRSQPVGHPILDIISFTKP